MRIASLGAAGCIIYLTTGCAVVPGLEAASGVKDTPVLISEIVQRVKCEVADALADKINQQEYLWMSAWTAKIDLTLQANEQGGVTPSVTYTNYFKNAFNFGAGPTSLTSSSSIAAVNQFFSVGASANFGEQAIRAEVISFTLSLKELRQWKYPLPGITSDYELICGRLGRLELTGNLGLIEWVNSALYPVHNHDLQAGIHPSPVTAAKPTLSSASHVTTYDGEPPVDYQKALEQIRTADSEASKALVDAKAKISAIDTSTSQIHRGIDPYLAVMEPELKRNILSNLLDLDKFSRDSHAALVDLETLRDFIAKALQIIQKDSNKSPVPAQNVTTVVNDARDATAKKNFIDDNASEALKIASTILKVDPPLDSLLHSVEFLVTYGATVSPGWTLLAWKGPSPASGSAASASGQRVNILNMALGPVSGIEQNRLIQNQTVTASTSH
jgi:hypothetical protein